LIGTVDVRKDIYLIGCQSQACVLLRSRLSENKTKQNKTKQTKQNKQNKTNKTKQNKTKQNDVLQAASAKLKLESFQSSDEIGGAMLGDINFQRLVRRLKILLFQRLLPQRKSQASPGEVLRCCITVHTAEKQG
jgi:hypothetical protein